MLGLGQGGGGVGKGRWSEEVLSAGGGGSFIPLYPSLPPRNEAAKGWGEVPTHR